VSYFQKERKSSKLRVEAKKKKINKSEEGGGVDIKVV
jgi:hypothetical protein